VDDRLPHKVRDGVRYERTQKLGKKIKAVIVAKRATNKELDEVSDVVKRAKIVYMINPTKYAATATEEQMARDLTLDDLGLEETHEILQCKIR
jgi:hypothetical protein